MVQILGARSPFSGSDGLLLRVELTAARDGDIRQRTIFLVDGDFGHAVQDFLTGHDVAEYGVFCVEMFTRGQGDEESNKVRSMSHGIRDSRYQTVCLLPFIPRRFGIE